MTVPVISQDNLVAFHAAHFSAPSINHFSQHFLGPVEEECPEEIEDDGLGYYEDGVKRTLTDEQIAIFRHSEIQALLRERRHAEEARDSDDRTPPSVLEDGELEPSTLEKDGAEELDHEDDGIVDDYPKSELPSPPPSHPQPSKKKQKSAKKARKAEQARQKGFFKQNIKPDLRKRTWDKVDSGVGNLDYDEDSGTAPMQNPASQRRRISYEDD